MIFKQFDTADKLRFRRSYSPNRPDDVAVSLWPKSNLNLGTMARACDAVGIKMLVSNIPEGEQAVKVGNTLGDKTRKVVGFVDLAHSDPAEWIRAQKRDWVLVAIEQCEGAKDYREFRHSDNYPTMYFIGNESYGIPEYALNLMDECVTIPQTGHCGSLNAVSSLEIVLYTHNVPVKNIPE